MAGGALAVPPMMLSGASANADPSDVRLLTETSTSAGAVAWPAYALGHTVRVRAEGGVAHHAVLRLLAADPLTWADRPPGCARLDSGHELRCGLGDVGGATVTRTATVSVPASAVERPPDARPSIVTVAAADNAGPRTSRAVLDLPSGGGQSATADAPPAQPQPAPNEGDAHCTADAPGAGRPCQDAAPGGNAAPPQSAPQGQSARPQEAAPASPCAKPPATTGPDRPHPANQGRPEHQRPPSHQGRPVHHAVPPQPPRPKPRAHPVQPMPPVQAPTDAQAPAHGKPPAHGRPPAHGQPSGHGKRPHHGTPADQGAAAYDMPSHHAAPKQHAAPSQQTPPKQYTVPKQYTAPSQHTVPKQYTVPKQHSATVDGGVPGGTAGGSGAHGHHTWSYGDDAPSEVGAPWDDDAPAAGGKHGHHGGASAWSDPSTEDGYPAGDWAGTHGGAGYGGTAGGGHVKQGQVPDLPVVPSPARPGVALPPLNAPGAMPVPNSQAMAGTTSDGTDRGDGRMTLVSPVGMEQGDGADWAVVLGVAIVAEIGLLWGAACFGLWRRRIALYRAETRAAEARAEAAARGGAYI